MMNFCVDIFNIEDGSKKQHLGMLRFIISRKVKKSQLKHTKKEKEVVQYMEKVLWLTERVKNNLWSFLLEVYCWMMLLSQVDQLKLAETKLRH